MGFLFEELSTMELTDLVKLARSEERDDSLAMGEIIRRFNAKAVAIARSICLSPADQDDVANAARYGVVKAVRAHDPARPGFANYVVAFMVGAARRESKRLAPRDICLQGRDLAQLMPKVWLVEAGNDFGWGDVDHVVRALPEDQIALLTERHVNDSALGGMATARGTSVSAVSQRLKTLHQRLGLSLVKQGLHAPTRAA